jgi:tryptophan-rich sensory protein
MLITICIIILAISLFLETLFRTTKWFEYQQKPPFILMVGFILAFFWALIIPTIICSAPIIYAGYKLGKFLKQYQIVIKKEVV